MENKRLFACGFMFDEKLENVVLLRKERPEWQKGLLNGVGGKVEEGEEPWMAMVREFREETGIDVIGWRKLHVIGDFDWEVHFFTTKGDISKVSTMTDEMIGIFDVRFLTNYITIDNLQWLIPKAQGILR